MAHILIIDDNETLRDGAAAIVKKMKHQATIAVSGREGISHFKTHQPDMVFTDLKMESVDGMEVLKQIKALDPDAVIVMMTGFGSIQTAVLAMQQGAMDFIEKPFSPDVLRAKVTAGLALRAERTRAEHVAHLSENAVQENTQRFTEIDSTGARRLKGIIGESHAMQEVYRVVEKVGRTDSTVHIRGESGTGKELVARAIHDGGLRRDQTFVGINCAAIPVTLIESELFGHEKGAFTGAVKRKLGRFELAHKGTIFLDEIGDLPFDVQAKLLRTLQDQTIFRVGGEKPIEIDVRIISATHRNLKKMVEEKQFREDLYFRLHIVPVELPPLRSRKADIPPLVQHFISKLGKRTNPDIEDIEDSALQALYNYDWPGNVRELENVIEQSLVFAEGARLTPQDLPALLGTLKPSDVSPAKDLPAEDDPRTLDEVLESMEKAMILRAYENAGQVKAETARKLGIKPSALYYKLAKYNIAENEST
jgi:two-component system, NtrC family, response regulator HydG